MKRQGKPSPVTISAIDFALTYAIQNLRKNKRWSWFELSFFIGKDDGQLVRNIENPLKSSKYSLSDLNYVFLIWDIPFDELALKNNISADDLLLSVTPTKIGRKVSYQIYLKTNNDTLEPLLNFEEEHQFESLVAESSLISTDAVRDFLNELLVINYFNSARTALEVYNKFQERFGASQHPANLIKVLIEFCDGRKKKILHNDRKNLQGRLVFYKQLDFSLDLSDKPISQCFKNQNIDSFKKAAEWVSNLDYRRNVDKDNVLCVFDEQCGTCSTKHALLKRLADENGNEELQLMLGIFAMNAKNTPAIKDILKKYKLKYIPEAHNYLRAYNYILDYTGIGINETKFELDIIQELEIQPDQITDFKVKYHKDFMDNWIEENKIPYSLDELWNIREECIKAIVLSR
ncbi:hypothetical protein [Sphingobacterium paucimobilis]|uniref:Uncharacterized protein n=1 Tax=Sphingobacterium paucimobilis HER1398 TaxID=1346330 RepID=U2HUN4_9SPHI|nr:hypothetical protein [Sphingobacterium paucimobilis]ERJ58990.1 hypothetical protein M472_09430 [Sphingobacterium paucimobilis HER1398]